jgi:hypothetical protein
MVTPEFADLVLLVNPAIEAARFIPIYDLVDRFLGAAHMRGIPGIGRAF